MFGLFPRVQRSPGAATLGNFKASVTHI
jgi:hypothetical protein